MSSASLRELIEAHVHSKPGASPDVIIQLMLYNSDEQGRYDMLNDALEALNRGGDNSAAFR